MTLNLYEIEYTKTDENGDTVYCGAYVTGFDPSSAVNTLREKRGKDIQILSIKKIGK